MISKKAQFIQTLLREKGLSSEVKELPASTRTANEAAVAIGCDLAQIVKSLLFRTLNTNTPILILINGAFRVDENQIEQFVHEKIVKADASYTREVTGFTIGGVPPIGHQQNITHIFIDSELLKFDEIWAAAGTPHAVFNLPSTQLEKLTGEKVIQLKASS